MQFILLNQGVRSPTQAHVFCVEVNLPVQVSWKVLDYIPFLSVILGIVHMALAMMIALPFVVMVDLVTLDWYNLTIKTHLLISFEMIRGVLCFLPFMGNMILYIMDHSPSERS